MAEEKGNFTAEAFPTQGGTYSAWLPESKDAPEGLSADGWRPVPMRRDPHGIPGASWSEPINAQIGMCSFAQAHAIAWQHAAHVEATTGKRVEVRVVEHRVKYDIKCYRSAESTDGVRAVDPAQPSERSDG